MSLAPIKKSKPAKKSRFDYRILLAVLGGLFLFGSAILMLVPIVVNLFDGFRTIVPMIGLILGLIGSVMTIAALILMKKYQLATTIGVTAAVLCTSTFIGWVRYNNFVSGNWNTLTEPETFSPINVFLSREFYKQQEFGAGVALTAGLVLLGCLASCIPMLRANDIPENLEKKKIEAERNKRPTAPARPKVR